MIEQWLELKETITELRDNNGTGTQQEICKFLVNMMDVLEKQMQEFKTWSLDDAREDFIYNVYNILDCLPTNDEANRIIDSFDRVTSGIRQESVLDKLRAEIKTMSGDIETIADVLDIVDKYKAGSEE